MKIRLADPQGTRDAFTLLEVMIAVIVFCTASFAILALVSSSLQNVRRLQRPMLDAGMVAAQLSLTNQLTEGVTSGDFVDLYPGYTWTRDVYEVGTNRLFQVDFVVQGNSADKPVVSKLSILLFRPQSPAGSLDGGMRR
jgi:type II secretory pathway pseudopilin PulG